MSFPLRTFGRALVAKLSDARERMHGLVEHAAGEPAPSTDSGHVSPRDIDRPASAAEVPRG